MDASQSTHNRIRDIKTQTSGMKIEVAYLLIIIPDKKLNRTNF